MTAEPEPVLEATGPADRSMRPRISSLDAARGLAVVGMLFVDNRGSAAIGAQLKHAQWHGLTVADTVFPLFLFAVGAAMPMSRRAARPRAVLWRVVKLLVLGYLIVSAKYGFGTVGVGVLGHIAGAYLLCWLVLLLPRRVQPYVVGAVLAVVTVLFVVVPSPGAGAATTGTSGTWAHWFDGLLGLELSAEAPHSYLTSAASIYVGVVVGRILLGHAGRAAVTRMLALAVTTGALGAVLTVVLPLNKRLWTPSYVLVTAAVSIAVLVGFYLVMDIRGVVRPFAPLSVLGQNAIVAFVLSEIVFRALLGRVAQTHVVDWMASWSSDAFAAYLYPSLSVVVIWAVCAALTRRGIVIRI